VSGLGSIPGVKCLEPAGAFYLMAELPVRDAEHFARWLLEDFTFEGRTVMVAPGPGFYITPGSGEREVRMAYVLNCDDLRGAVRVLDQALQVYPGRI